MITRPHQVGGPRPPSWPWLLWALILALLLLVVAYFLTNPSQPTPPGGGLSFLTPPDDFRGYPTGPSGPGGPSLRGGTTPSTTDAFLASTSVAPTSVQENLALLQVVNSAPIFSLAALLVVGAPFIAWYLWRRRFGTSPGRGFAAVSRRVIAATTFFSVGGLAWLAVSDPVSQAYRSGNRVRDLFVSRGGFAHRLSGPWAAVRRYLGDMARQVVTTGTHV